MNFQDTYRRTAYLDFFRDTLLPDDFEITEESIPLGFQADRITDVIKLGEVPSLDLPVFEIKHKSENDPRVSISKEAFRILANYGKQQALILFISTKAANFRLSLVTLDLKLEGRKVTKEYSNPRRYSFFLGPQCKVHTPKQYLSKRIIDMDDLKSRFSIEVVNKEFFTQIALLFTQLTGGTRKIGSKKYEEKGCLKLPQTNDDTFKKEFAVRLIGRLIFCWFLKKKASKADVPLIPEDILSVDAVDKAKKDTACVGGYYHSTLEPLFFEVLNTPTNDRKKAYKKSPWSIIPFLNGGLFNPHLNDFYDLAFTGSSKHLNDLIIPDDWLKELLDIFETYNFTIDENTPVDVELSIEPEMLGRIFENLLAEINPETGDTARKATGSYYTPRPIVEYMVDESLKQYLVTKTGIAEDKIASLLSYADEDGSGFTAKQTETLVEALHAVKIIDPACGSGAFPLGILQKILLMLQKLDPDSKIWLNKMLSVIPDPMYREELKKKNIPNYLHKLGIIKDCIFGVDIQPIAVEISKLRCFLSLIVDEKVNDNTNNRGIEHLPNLEFKFVCANTLIGLPEKTKIEKTKKGTFDQVQLFEASDKIDELKELRDLYLTSYGSEKKKIEERFRIVQSEMAEHNRKMYGQAAQTAKLSQWDPFSDEASSWFDPDWMFGIKEGFNIVIGNPPYISVEKFAHTPIQKIWKKQFKTYASRCDVYCFFYEKGFSLLSEDGILAFISSNKFQRSGYGKNLRQLLTSKHIYTIIDFCELPVFAAGTDPMIVISSNKSSLKLDKINVLVVKKSYEIETISKSMATRSTVFLPEQLKTEGWALEGIFGLSLIDKMNNNGIPLIEYVNNRFHYGIKTGLNEAFVINRETRDSLIAEDGKSSELIKPWIRGKDIGKWTHEYHDLYVIIVPFGFSKELNKYPAILCHLTKYKDKLKNRGQCKTSRDGNNEGQHHWLELDNNPSKSYIASFDEPKIVFNETSKRLHAYLDIDGNAINKTGFIILSPDAKFILSLMNSKLMDWFFRSTFPSWGDPWNSGRIQFRGNLMKKIPIPYTKKSTKDKLSGLVDDVINASQSVNKGLVSKIENQIDQMVYQLYGLTDKEITIVEDSVK